MSQPPYQKRPMNTAAEEDRKRDFTVNMLRRKRQNKAHGCPFPQLTFRPDLAAVPLHHLFSEREPYAAAWHLGRCTGRATIKVLKDIWKRFRRNTAARIRHRNL